jgi:hypothetical protein
LNRPTTATWATGGRRSGWRGKKGRGRVEPVDRVQEFKAIFEELRSAPDAPPVPPVEEALDWVI